jgi:hypothetical protein
MAETLEWTRAGLPEVGSWEGNGLESRKQQEHQDQGWPHCWGQALARGRAGGQRLHPAQVASFPEPLPFPCFLPHSACQTRPSSPREAQRLTFEMSCDSPWPGQQPPAPQGLLDADSSGLEPPWCWTLPRASHALTSWPRPQRGPHPQHGPRPQCETRPTTASHAPDEPRPRSDQALPLPLCGLT